MKRELESLKRELQEQYTSNKYEADYKKELTLVKNNYQELKLVNDQQQQEIARLKGQLKQAE